MRILRKIPGENLIIKVSNKKNGVSIRLQKACYLVFNKSKPVSGE